MILKINNKDIKLGYGLYFLGKAIKERETDIIGLLNGINKYPISEVVDLMYFSAKCEAELDETILPISKRDLLNFLEANNDFTDDKGNIAKFSKGLVDSIQEHFLPHSKEVAEDTTDEKKN